MIITKSDTNTLPTPAFNDEKHHLRPLEKLKVEKRGWTLDVLQAVQSLDKPELGRAEAAPLHKTFSLHDVYQFEKELSRLHFANRYVRHKIRPQLQVLRDLAVIQFLGGGDYRLS